MDPNAEQQPQEQPQVEGSAPVDLTVQAAKPDPMSEVTKALQTMAQRMGQNEQLLGAVAQRLAPQQKAESAEEPEQDFVDPAVQKVLMKRDQMWQQRLEELQDRQDWAEYDRQLAKYQLDEEELKTVNGVYAAWKANNVTISGRTPSRVDALYYGLGKQFVEKGLSQRAAKAREAAESLRASNGNAFVERPGRSTRAPSGLDPDKMSRKERLEKYYPAALDEEGF